MPNINAAVTVPVIAQSVLADYLDVYFATHEIDVSGFDSKQKLELFLLLHLQHIFAREAGKAAGREHAQNTQGSVIAAARAQASSPGHRSSTIRC